MRRGWADDLRKTTTTKNHTNKPTTTTTTVKEKLEKQSKPTTTPTAATVKKEEEEEDCVMLDGDPSKPAAVEAGNGSRNAESDEVVVVAEKGQIACRDYPHARHLCVTFPFKTDPHEKYCDLCHCYVCDTKAPCSYWGTGKSSNGHCHSTDKEEIWRNLRQVFKQVNVPPEQHRTTMSNEPFTHPVVNCSPFLEAELLQTFQALDSDWYGSILGGGFENVDEDYCGYGVNDYFNDSDDDDDNYDYDVGVQRVSLTGSVKWFNSEKGYGFIIPDNGGDDLFVHYSSIKSVGRQSLTEGEKVEFQVDIDNHGRKKAINVSCRAGSFVQGTSGTTTSNEPLMHRVGTCFTILEPHEPRETLGSLNSLHLDQPVVQAERLTGTVKWFNSQKGYGFIIPDNGGDDLFVHHSSVEYEEPQMPIEGEKVEFLIDTDNYGRSKAINVSRLGQASSGTSVSNDQHGVDELRKMLQTLNSDGSGAQGDGLTGTVRWFDSLKGYGFIIPDGGGQDLFVHRSSIESAGYQSLSEGETVKFQIDTDEYGRKRAINVVSEFG